MNIWEIIKAEKPEQAEALEALKKALVRKEKKPPKSKDKTDK